VAAAAAAAAAGIDAPQLTLTTKETATPASASAPAAQTTTNHTMVLISVVFVAGILGLAAVHAVLRSKPSREHAKLPVLAQSPDRVDP